MAGLGNIAGQELDRKWRSTAKAVFGEDVGPLTDFAPWLSKARFRVSKGKSCLSGKEVTCAFPTRPAEVNVIAFDEIDFEKKYAPLSINELKDIDSIARAVSERAIYAGNVVLGNSQVVEGGTTIIDSSFIFEAGEVGYSKYNAYTYEGTYNECVFGCRGLGHNSFAINSFNLWKCTRCFEAYKLESSADCYYSHGLVNCQNCFFCFNVKNKKHAIGNLALPPDKYLQIKRKLLEEMRAKLAKGKELPSLLSIVGACKSDYKELKKAYAEMGKKAAAKQGNGAKAEEAFSSTMKIIFGREQGNLSEKKEWLLEKIPRIEEGKSCASGSRLLIPPNSNYTDYPRNRLITLEEAEFVGERLNISQEAAGKISFENAAQIISDIAYLCAEWRVGTQAGNVDCPSGIESTDCLMTVLPIESKACAYSYLARNSESLFGTYYTRYSQFCIRCYQSAKLSRCAECDNCRDCTDCLFCHNCENVRDSMFCFNVKNLKNAIGNVELPREKYLEIKKRVVDELNGQLGKDGKTEISIFDVGLKKR